MKIPIFTGASAALITPFKDGKIDYESIEKIIDKQICAGSEAVTVCGTTGETSTLTKEEYISVLSFVKDLVGTNCKIIAGSGTNDTKTSIEKSIIAADCGADALLVVTPYYNKTSQNGLIKHYETIADSTLLPIILYNVPGRTGISFTVNTYKTLSQIENINGVKEASGNFNLIAKTIKECDSDLNVWSGNDNETLEIMALGGLGVISVAANIIPDVMMKITDHCDDGEFDRARELVFTYYDLIEKMFIDVNPIAIKEIMYQTGICSNEVRLPLCTTSESNKIIISKTLNYYKNRALI